MKIKALILAVFSLGTTIFLGYYLRESPANESGKKAFFGRKPSQALPVEMPLKTGAKVLFVGDMMFDRWIRQVSQKNGQGHILEKTDNVLRQADLVVGNLEGPITQKASVSVASQFGSRENYIFTFPPETADFLFKKNIRLVNIGNNHILNMGEQGVEETRNNLKQAQINYFGGKEEPRYFIKKIGNLRLAFVSYNQFEKNSEELLWSDMTSAKNEKPDFIVVYTHWGAEYASRSREKERNLARQMIDAGVDLVIGSHPHVIQEKESYKNKMIYYSLGNFIFDQYFDDRTMAGRAVMAEFGQEKNIEFREFGVMMARSGQTSMEEL